MGGVEGGEERGQEVGVEEQVEEEPALARVGEAWGVVVGQVGQVGRIHSPGPHLLEQIREWTAGQNQPKIKLFVFLQTILLCIEWGSKQG